MPKITRNIAVIGGAGFIGSHVVDELIEKGDNVLVLDNLLSGSLENVNPKAKFKTFDITHDWKELAEILGKYWINYVIHLAAEPYIPECYDRPRQFFEVNAFGTLNVLLACKEVGIERLLYYSSSEIYGTKKGKIDELDHTYPQSTYAVSKLAGDRICFTFFKEHKVPVVILRQFNCYGERETHEYVIPEIISQLEKSDTIKLGNIKAERDFLYVKDAAKMAVELLEKGKVGEVYNLGAGNYHSVEHIANLIAKIMGRKIKIEIDKKRLRPFDVERLWCDNSKIYKIIENRPKTSFREGLKRTIDWFYDHDKKWGFEQNTL